MNEEFGDGIMSAIDMFATVKKIKGKGGEARCVITLNGKVCPDPHLWLDAFKISHTWR